MSDMDQEGRILGMLAARRAKGPDSFGSLFQSSTNMLEGGMPGAERALGPMTDRMSNYLSMRAGGGEPGGGLFDPAETLAAKLSKVSPQEAAMVLKQMVDSNPTDMGYETADRVAKMLGIAPPWGKGGGAQQPAAAQGLFAPQQR